MVSTRSSTWVGRNAVYTAAEMSTATAHSSLNYDGELCWRRASACNFWFTAASTGVSGPDFVVGDFNHNAMGDYLPTITWGRCPTG
jgi:hypothetical protein